MHTSLLASQTGHSHLRRLFMLRNWAILAQLGVELKIAPEVFEQIAELAI
jgi:hypothetical protein